MKVTTRPTRKGVQVRPFAPVWKSFPPGTPLQEITDWINKTKRELQDKRDAMPARSAAAAAGTVTADAEKFLTQKEGELETSSFKSLRSEVNAWVKLYGPRRRWSLKKEDAIEARRVWQAEKYSDKTIDNRMLALGGLFHTLDGEKAPTPIDAIAKLVDAKKHGHPRTIAPQTIQTVARNLKRAGDDLNLGRYLVLTATGRRPSELKRAIPIDWTKAPGGKRQGVWQVKTGKGGDPTPLTLLDDEYAAMEFFVKVGGFEANATWDQSQYVKVLYEAGWPQDWDRSSKRGRNRLRPYQARHSVALALAEAGVDWKDIAARQGNNDAKTTQKFYTGFVASRLVDAAERLAEARPLGVSNLLKTKSKPPRGKQKRTRRARVVEFRKTRREEVKAG